MKVGSIAVGMLGMGLALASNADAAWVLREYYQTAPTNCQAALPSGAGSVLRARPLGIGNEGNTTAFVTCGFSEDIYEDRPTLIMASVINNGAADATITCTLVSGSNPQSLFPAIYVPKTVVLEAGFANVFQWHPSDVDDESFIRLPNLSCSLPPNTVLRSTNVRRAIWTEATGP